VEPKLVLLFELRLVAQLDVSLQIATGQRRIASIKSGNYQGPRLKGSVLAGGSDWLLKRADGVREIDARIVLREEADGEVISIRYVGYRTAAQEVLAGEQAAEVVDPNAFVYRTAHLFEASGRCAWLNDVVGAGIGLHSPQGLVHRVYYVS
jgi:hypothetical protein